MSTLRPALRLVRDYHKGKELVGAEIGVSFGKHALCMLKGLSLKHLFLIDPYIMHEDYDQFDAERMVTNEKTAHEKLKEYEDKITWMRAKSADAVTMFEDESLDFVYIDGNHIARFALEDMELYYPKVKKGGFLCGHDYRPEKEDRVAVAVNEFCLDRKLEFGVGGVDWWIFVE